MLDDTQDIRLGFSVIRTCREDNLVGDFTDTLTQLLLLNSREILFYAAESAVTCLVFLVAIKVLIFIEIASLYQLRIEGRQCGGLIIKQGNHL